MDRDQFRKQITHRYITGKALDGASLEEIAKGTVDPVEQMTYVTGLSKTKCTTNTESTPSSALLRLVFLALIALLLLFIHS